MKKIFTILLTITFLLTPVFAWAGLENPLGDANMTIGDIFGRIVKAFLGLIAFVALVYFIYGGFLLLTSAGNAEKVEKAKNTLVYGVLGIVITYTSWQILRFVLESIGAP